MKNITLKQKEIELAVSALLDFFELPQIPVIFTGSEYENGALQYRVSDIERSVYNPNFLFSISGLYRTYEKYPIANKNRLHLKSNTFKSFVFGVILHEIGHYRDYLREGYNYARKSENRGLENEADNFSAQNNQQANFFIKEVLRGA